MKKLITVLLGFSLTLTAFGQYTAIAVGTSLPMPNKEVKDISGKTLTLQNMMDKNGLLVMFSCNTCPYVIKNQARTLAIAAFAKENNIGIILLNANEAQRNGDDSFEAMKAYAAAQQYNFPYAVDENSIIANAFGATRTPEIFLFDAKGVLQYKGAIDDSPADATNVKRIHTREAIKELVSGSAIQIKESKSVGCSIKRKA